MNDENFFDLAMKVIARQSTDAEREELEALLAREPELRAEFERLKADVRVTKEALPLLDASQATAGDLPGYARERLQTKVRQTLGRSTVEKRSDRSTAWNWRWALGLAAAAIVILLFTMRSGRDEFVVQVAVLDTLGTTRGNNTNELATLQQVWTTASIQSFSKLDELSAWEQKSPPAASHSYARIVYDRTAGEVRVTGQYGDKAFRKTFAVEHDLAATLNRVNSFILQQNGKAP